MRRTTRGMTPALAAVSAVLLMGVALAQDKVPAIKEIMARLNKPGGLYPTLSKELKDDDPDWGEVQQQAKTFTKMAAALGKNVPPKGDSNSWARLTQEYVDNARALEAAADKKDRPAAAAARLRLGGDACSICHKAHMKK
jgi:cytochrome c556